MKRYFYPASRAHHALCMAIDHGFKFVKANGELWSHEGIAAIDPKINYHFTLCPHTVLLLTPVRSRDLTMHGVCALADLPIGSGPNSILQRDGKPFAMPDCEEA